MYRTTPIHCSIGDLISDFHKLTAALKLQEMVKQGGIILLGRWPLLHQSNKGGDNLVETMATVTPELSSV